MESVTLYKYREYNEHSLEILYDEMIWYSSPSNLNDTFEFQVPIVAVLSPIEIVRHCKQRYDIRHISPILLDAMMKTSGKSSFPIESDFIKIFLDTSIDNHFIWCIAIILFYDNAGLSDQEIVSKLFPRDNIALLAKIQEELVEANALNRKFAKHTGVLSLSATRENPLMWAHYADSCKGFCVGINILNNTNTSVPVPVTYTSTLPIVLPSQFYDADPDNVYDMIMKQYATKSYDWEYEKEVRFFSREANCLHPIPGLVTEVIIGENMPTKQKLKIIEATEKMKNPVALFQVARSVANWGYRCLELRT